MAKAKKIAKTKGNALPSGALEFHNPGHAAQSRYIAALVNPFAAPPVPIPDSFLTAHCVKIAKEVVVTSCGTALLSFVKSSDDSTGNYQVYFTTFSTAGVAQTTAVYTCNTGCRIVAAGVHYENSASPLNINGMVTLKQTSGAAAPGLAVENSRIVSTTHRDTGEGNMRYAPLRRQSLSFEGDASEKLEVVFTTAFTGILRFAFLGEVDGDSGFVENIASNNDFVLTTHMANHHAGQFADTPLPDVHATSIPAKHTALQKAGNSLFHGLWSAGSSFVSSAAGWAVKNPTTAFNAIKQLPYVGSLFGSSSVVASMETAAIRAAPSLLMLGI